MILTKSVLHSPRDQTHLVLREVSRDPGTAGVHHAIELEREDAGLVGGGSAERK